MKTIILLVLVAGASAQLLEQQIALQQQQALGIPIAAAPSLPLQQQLLYPGMQSVNFGAYGYPNQLLFNNYNPYLINSPLQVKSPYLPTYPLTAPLTGPVTVPAVETVKEVVNVLRPEGLTGTVEMDGLEAYIQEQANKGIGHREVYAYSRSALPNSGRSSVEFGGYPQQARLMKTGNRDRPSWWLSDFDRKRFKQPFTVNKPEHKEIYLYN